MAATKKEDNVLVAIDKDKGSQYALKWAVDHLLNKNQSVTLFHVRQKPSIPTTASMGSVEDDGAKKGPKRMGSGKEIFVPFRCFCSRKEICCNEVLVEDVDISKAILNYVSANAIEILVLGAPSKGGLVRFRAADMPTKIQKTAPEFCTVYIIAKGKVSSVRAASGPPPAGKPALQNQLQNKPTFYDVTEPPMRTPSQAPRERSMYAPPTPSLQDDMEIKSPFNRQKGPNSKLYDPSIVESDVSFASGGRPGSERMFPSFTESLDPGTTPPYSASSEYDFRCSGSSYSVNKSVDMGSFSSTSQDNARMSRSSENTDEVEAEMRRLRFELKQTMDMYSTACKEALTAKQKATELHRWKLEEQQKLEEARMAEEAALALVEKEKAKSKVAIEAAETAQRLAQLEAQKRMIAEKKALREAEERKKAVESMGQADIRYRRYTIEEIEEATENLNDSLKIGEGGYGPVYKCYLDHTPVAVKVLRPDAAQGRAQFQQEVEVLSCIRHPNMVLLLGACPEYGCLVYEHMANGSLEDCLFRRGNSPILSWQMRFRISAEIATGLLFLHQTKPEPLVHRDLKPGNILLDRNYVSKISDVGLARLVPPSVANNVTQYRMTSTAGTFCYIDPEYQQTGMLGTKSDIYSLGIMLLQIITAKPPMGLTHHVERAIERGTFPEVLDPAVTDWPLEEAMKFAKLSLKCAELRRKDRPDLGKIILPELNRLRALAEDNMPNLIVNGTGHSSSDNQSSTAQVSLASIVQDVVSAQQSGYDSYRSRSSTSNFPGRK